MDYPRQCSRHHVPIRSSHPESTGRVNRATLTVKLYPSVILRFFTPPEISNIEVAIHVQHESRPKMPISICVDCVNDACAKGAN